MLTIDDEVAIQQILQHYFAEKFTVISKDNGKAGLTWMLEGKIPDVIIADIEMPEMNGFEFIKQVRASGFLNHIPLIMLSSKEDSDSRIKCLETGADDYLVKPFNPRELAARIQVILRRIGKNVNA